MVFCGRNALFGWKVNLFWQRGKFTIFTVKLWLKRKRRETIFAFQELNSLMYVALHFSKVITAEHPKCCLECLKNLLKVEMERALQHSL